MTHAALDVTPTPQAGAQDAVREAMRHTAIRLHATDEDLQVVLAVLLGEVQS